VSKDELNKNRNLVLNKRVKATFDFVDFQVGIQTVKAWPIDPLSISFLCVDKPRLGDRGVRIVTIGITGLWWPSVQSDVTF